MNNRKQIKEAIVYRLKNSLGMDVTAVEKNRFFDIVGREEFPIVLVFMAEEPAERTATSSMYELKPAIHIAIYSKERDGVNADDEIDTLSAAIEDELCSGPSSSLASAPSTGSDPVILLDDLQYAGITLKPFGERGQNDLRVLAGTMVFNGQYIKDVDSV